MTMTIEFPRDLQDRLDKAAREKGMTPESLVLTCVREQLSAEQEAAGEPVESMAEFLEGYVGVFDSRDFVPGGARLSERTSERFAEILEEKRRRGHL